MAKTLKFRDPQAPPSNLSAEAVAAWRAFLRGRPGWRGDRLALARHCRTIARADEGHEEFRRVSEVIDAVARLMKKKRGREKAVLQTAWIELNHRLLDIADRNRRASLTILRFRQQHEKPRLPPSA